jgi:non-ribosomal peptide synthetase component E (peptide arylation enzyme)
MPSLNIDALTAFLGERLTRYKVPAHIQLLAALPKTAVGKADKPALRKLALALAK